MILPDRRSRGLTLVELLVGLVIIGILATMMAPTIKGTIVKRRLASINSELISDVNYARTEAIQNGDDIAITFFFSTTLKDRNSRSIGTGSCYTIQRGLPGTNTYCRCYFGAGHACAGATTELKTVVIPKSDTGIALTQRPGTQNSIVFSPPIGIPKLNSFGVLAPPAIDLKAVSPYKGSLRTTMSVTGLTSFCSPDGSMIGVPTC